MAAAQAVGAAQGTGEAADLRFSYPASESECQRARTEPPFGAAFLIGRVTISRSARLLVCASTTIYNFVIATNEFRGGGAPERTEYHNLVAWDRLAEICGQLLSQGRHADLADHL